MEKRSYLMLYDCRWNTPNGDPFTGEQRYDNSNEFIMVSDLRIKRFIRDKMIQLLIDVIFYQFDTIEAKKVVKQLMIVAEEKAKKETDVEAKAEAKSVVEAIAEAEVDAEDKNKKVSKGKKVKKLEITGSAYTFRKNLVEMGLLSDITKFDPKKIKIDLNSMLKFLDVRLFGGLLTESGINLSLEGAIQFKNMSYSLNKIKPEIFQNTSVFPSDISKTPGLAGLTTIIPYSIIAVEGWLNEQTAHINNLTEEDIDKMLSCLWLGIRDKNSRSKSGQSPILLIEVVYKEKVYKFNPEISVFKSIQNISSLVSITSDINEIDIRDRNDYTLHIDKLISECIKDNVKVVNFYTEDEDLKIKLESYNIPKIAPKFNFKELY